MSLFAVRNLCFGYGVLPHKSGMLHPNTDTPSFLEDITFSLDVGRIYDLTGPSGAGKSMLLRACAQMMPIAAGHLMLNDKDSAHFTFQEWRRHVCLVPQHASLVPGTIRDNLVLPWTLKVHRGDSVPTDAELKRLLEAAQLEVSLDRDAAKVSGGQAARIALLRVFATKPTVLLLDEVDAALDDESAQAVGQLTAQMVGLQATCLRIRHRSPDGIANGIFHLEERQLSYMEAAPEASRY